MNIDFFYYDKFFNILNMYFSSFIKLKKFIQYIDPRIHLDLFFKETSNLP
jgi:hypothetical protein